MANARIGAFLNMIGLPLDAITYITTAPPDATLPITPAIARTAMLEGGEWRATAIAADPITVGYHLSALYSPIGWLSWERIVRAWEAAQGSDEAIKAFRNTILGETWVETGEAPDWQRLYDRRERWKSGTVPAGGLFLTAGADVQKDRIKVDVWAWGRGLESWLVDHVVIEGGPDRHDAWSELTAMLDRSWLHERGAHLRIARLAIDIGYEAYANNLDRIETIRSDGRIDGADTDYWIDIPDIPGCVSRGATPEAAKANFREALAQHLGGAGAPPAAPRTADQLTKEELEDAVDGHDRALGCRRF